MEKNGKKHLNLKFYTRTIYEFGMDALQEIGTTNHFDLIKIRRTHRTNDGKCLFVLRKCGMIETQQDDSCINQNATESSNIAEFWTG